MSSTKQKPPRKPRKKPLRFVPTLVDPRDPPANDEDLDLEKEVRDLAWALRRAVEEILKLSGERNAVLMRVEADEVTREEADALFEAIHRSASAAKAWRTTKRGQGVLKAYAPPWEDLSEKRASQGKK